VMLGPDGKIHEDPISISSLYRKTTVSEQDAPRSQDICLTYNMKMWARFSTQKFFLDKTTMLSIIERMTRTIIH